MLIGQALTTGVCIMVPLLTCSTSLATWKDGSKGRQRHGSFIFRPWATFSCGETLDPPIPVLYRPCQTLALYTPYYETRGRIALGATKDRAQPRLLLYNK